MPQPQQSTEPLHGVRGIAATMVFVSHLGNAGYYPWIKGFGQLGVLLFFVLSGFLMGLLYMKERSSARDWGRYAVRRVFRVYPLFVFVVLGSWLAFEVFEQTWSLEMAGDMVFDHLILQQGLMLLWTIPVEMKFYACFPFIAYAVTSLRSPTDRTRLLAVLVVAFLALPVEISYTEVWRFLPIFTAGLLAAQLYLDAQSEPPSRPLPWNLLWVASAIGVVLMTPVVSIALFGAKVHPFRQVWWSVAPGFLFVLAATRSSGWLYALLTSRPARFLGTVSYSLYLTHLPTLWFFDQNLPFAPIVKAPIIVVAVLVVAWVSYRLIETPFRRLGQGLARAV